MATLRISIILLSILVISCNQKSKKAPMNTLDLVPITTPSSEAKAHFEKARHLVQNGIDGNPTEYYEKALALDSQFVRMHNFISIYSPDDSIKRHHHNQAKKYQKIASKEEQQMVEATEFRFNHPNDINEEILINLAKKCTADKYLYHTIAFLLFRKSPERAIAAGKRAVGLDKNYGSGYNILGYAFINNEELNKAEIAFDNFIRCEPNQANPYDSKGDLLLRMGRFEEALELKKKAYSIDSSFYWIPEEIPGIQAKVDSLKNL